MQIIGRNINHVFPIGINLLLSSNAVARGSRVGRVLEAPGPVTSTYQRPDERVLFEPRRRANHFFHFFEGLWMLAGRRDVTYVADFVPRMKEFSDDGVNLNGAYGYRWRQHFDIDQIQGAIMALRHNPDDRRVYVGMWDPWEDFRNGSPIYAEGGRLSRDVPCNVGLHFYIRQGRLTMTVFNRSNDVVWGAYGANVVHMSMLHEFVARMVGVPLGEYHQISSSFHIYVDRDDVKKLLKDAPIPLGQPFSYLYHDPYEEERMTPFPMVDDGMTPKRWWRELMLFLEDPTAVGFDDPFFSRVAKPMWCAWSHLKNTKNTERHSEARDIISGCVAPDWRKACLEQIYRSDKT
jgi:hypothetical protein